MSQPMRMPPPHYAQRSGYDYSDNYDDNSDTLKKAVLLSGVSSGKLNPVTAVALSNSHMSTTDTAVATSLGNGFATVAALGAENGQGGLFGSSSGGGSSNGFSGGSNGGLLNTLVVANALSPSSSSSNNAASNIATFALLSGMQNNNNNDNGPF